MIGVGVSPAGTELRIVSSNPGAEKTNVNPNTDKLSSRSCVLRPSIATRVQMVKPPDHVTSGFEIVPAVLERHEIADVAGVLQENGFERSRAAALGCVIGLRLHIDDSGPDNGPLRVLPGTPTRGVMSDGEIAQLAHDTQSVDCVSPAGGVVFMRPLLVHASSKAETDRRRRVLHIEYADSLDIGAGLQLSIA